MDMHQDKEMVNPSDLPSVRNNGAGESSGIPGSSAVNNVDVRPAFFFGKFVLKIAIVINITI